MNRPPSVQVAVVKGEVSASVLEHAREKVGGILGLTSAPLLSARVTLAHKVAPAGMAPMSGRGTTTRRARALPARRSDARGGRWRPSTARPGLMGVDRPPHRCRSGTKGPGNGRGDRARSSVRHLCCARELAPLRESDRSEATRLRGCSSGDRQDLIRTIPAEEAQHRRRTLAWAHHAVREQTGCRPPARDGPGPPGG
jgi:hypothetical protein